MGNPIGAVGQLVAVLRSQLAQRGGAAAPRARARKTAARREQQPIGALIERRVNSIALDDPQAGRKAFRIFLEAVLLNEFGDAALNDPRFYQMVDQVQHALDQDPASRPLVDQAIAELLQRARPGDSAG